MKTRRILPLAGVVVALATGAATSPAHAQFGPFSKPKIDISAPKLPTDGTDKQTLGEVNRCAQTGMNAMPGSFSENYEKKAQAMAEAQGYYDQCKTLFATVVNGKNDEGATRRWKEFQLAFENGLVELEMLRVYEPVAVAQGQGVPVMDADLDAIDKTRKTLDKGLKGDDAKRTIGWWKDRTSGLRDKNKDLLKHMAAKKASDAAAADVKRKNEVLDQLDQLIEAMQATADAGKEAIAESQFAAAEPLLKEADAYNPATRVSYGYHLFAFRVYNAWHAEKPHAAVAQALGATLVSEGALTAKAGKVKVNGAADTCYALMGRFVGGTGQEKVEIDPVEDKNWSKRQGFIHRGNFNVHANDWWKRGWYDFEGACTTAAHAFDLSVKLEFPGSKTNFEWAVVSFPKNAIPLEVLADVGLVHNDGCDAIHYKEVFTHPFPKMSYYSKDGMPFVYQDADDGNARMADGTNPMLGQVNTAPEPLKLPTPRDMGTCYDASESQNPAIKAYGQCLDRLQKQYGGQVESAANAVDSARTIGGSIVAERRLASLREAWGKAEATQCTPLRNKVQKAMDQAVTEVADWYAAEKPTFDGSLLEYFAARERGLKRFEQGR